MSEFNPHRKALIRKAIKERKEFNASTMKLKPGFLAIAVLLINGRASYVFNHKAGKGNAIAIERLLNENDAFVISDYKVGLITEDPAAPGIGVLQSAPSQFNFPAQTGQLDPTHLEAIFSPGASLSLKVNDVTYAEAIPTWPCRVVGTDQATEQRAIAGVVPMEPTLTIDGSKKTDLVLEMPTFTGSKVQYSDANGVQNPTSKRVYVMLYLDGYLVSNGSNLGNLAASDMV